MNFKILGDSDCPLVHIELRTDETIKLERGAMAYISNAHLEGKMNSSKRAWRSFERYWSKHNQWRKYVYYACYWRK